MRIWVWGGGSIGMLYAAKLSASGTDTVLITRSREQAAGVSASGILFTDGHGQVSIPCRSLAAEEAAELTGEHELPDWILLTVKQYGIDHTLLHHLQAIGGINPYTKVLAMQNGIGHLELLSEYYPAERVYGAVISEGAGRTSSISVQHTGSGFTRIGPAKKPHELGETDRFHLKELQKLLHNAGFRTDLSNNLNNDLWQKLIINSVINPLTALLEIRNGELIRHDSLLKVMRRLYDEALAVAAHSGVRTEGALWESLLDVCSRTADNRSSMLQDWLAGRPTELGWINGAIVRTAEEVGIRVPTHEMVLQLMQAKEEIR